MPITTWISVISAIAAITAAVIAGLSLRKQKPKTICTITNPQSPTYQNIGRSNVLLVERILTIDNIGDSPTPVFVDVWTSFVMAHPPSIDTAYSYILKKIHERSGHYGKYVNLQIEQLPPSGSLLLHLYCRADKILKSDEGFFSKIDITDRMGKVKVSDQSSNEWYDGKQIAIPHSLSE